jgi:hypothetical protein
MMTTYLSQVTTVVDDEGGRRQGKQSCRVENLNVYSAVVSRIVMHNSVSSILLTSVFKAAW